MGPHFEPLYAEALLAKYGFSPPAQYETMLDRMFLQAPEDRFLLELEELSGDFFETCARFSRDWDGTSSRLDATAFGQSLFAGLERAYHADAYGLAEFSRRGYALWRALPEPFSGCEPFFTLSYADDPLSFGDAAQTRQLYETAFAYD